MAPQLGPIEGLERVSERVRDGRRLVGEQDAADRDRRRELADGGADGLLAHRLDEAFGGDAHGAGTAFIQDDAEFVRRIAAHGFAAAEPALDDAGHGRENFVADLEAKAVVDRREIVDGRHQEAARLLGAIGSRQDRAERFHETDAIELAGQLVVVRAVEEALLFPVPLVDDADHAANTQETVRRVERALAVIFQPKRGIAAPPAGGETILDAKFGRIAVAHRGEA